ncbi:NDR1/HIN1-like protein 10 [Vicia villosa]|uniref:NDR1/HIN1-like protein 10 n=1 Tax=Vicia villosa TaxID=3911 RepID=UPI00273C306A|nr:NDR1/HIN1-like protein 10 [Vicia villosa]
MADNKQPQLNGAYYGPAIPPPAQPHPYHQRSRSCCCCLFSFFWKVLLTLIVLAGLAVLIFYLVVQPRSFKFYVTEANLTEFDYKNNTLHYNMALNFTARNPNKKLSIYYDKVEALAFYEGSRLTNNVDVITFKNSFRQYKKSSDPMSVVFSGQKLLVLDNDQVSEFNEDKSVEVYDIYVKLYFRIRFRLGDLISGDYKPKVKCDFKVPLNSNKTAAATFVPTKCDVDFY